ncbi:peptide deformylase [Candidatus Aquarickettsia rohweri]|uniref:Peptide deformylase n=2 Tax=Candidatus Aquarickettsia rohweri TaxID=2602574 RepID=A0A3R9ZQV0_9RICK|nr:peptide deformylase [Candidatus Aquarickettsia rohweri]
MNMKKSNIKILPLVLEPDPILHKKSELVKNIDQEIKEFSNNLIATMQHHKGLGLAAVQVGVLKKIIAVDITNLGRKGDKFLDIKEGPKILINPEIIEKSDDKKIYAEGCLSFGNILPEVERANRVKVKYLDLNGEEKFLEVSDNIISACIQHEIDHINGIVFLDRLSRIKRDFMMKKYLKWRKNISNSQ